MKYDEGSFRDRNGRIFYKDNSVFRALSQNALNEWNVFSETEFFRRFHQKGKIVQTHLVHDRQLVPDGYAAALEHSKIPFISYPYEWCFSMLKDAALLHIELLSESVAEGIVLKDASAYNVQWQGASPVFIDLLSFKKLQDGEPWVGYRQFCQMFLFPLFLQAYKGIPFHTWLRGSVDGITVEDFAGIISFRDLFRPGAFVHGYLQSKFQAGYAGTDRNLRTELKTAGFNRDLIKRNIDGLGKLIRKMNWKPDRSEWSDYASDNSYSKEDQQRKIKFIGEVVHLKNWKMVWDLGCNTGVFSRIASENAEYVVSMDYDHLSVERLYNELKNEGNKKILPIVMNIADPSPGLGWQGAERKTLTQRGRPDLVFALALIHHLVISANIPVAQIVSWLADLGGSLIIEFPTKEDSMVKKLLLNKEDQYTDYELNYFERELTGRFKISRKESLTGGTRFLFFCEPMHQA